MPLIYFVRHGQTDWNAEQRMQGHMDIPLNDTGRGQAARNGALLARLLEDHGRFDFVSSPLIRAAETMQILRREIGIIPEHYRKDLRLREIHLGDWQGLNYTEIADIHPEMHRVRDEDPWNFLYPGEGGESFAGFSARVLDWLDSVRIDTVVTSHGGVLRALNQHVTQMDKREAIKLDVPQDRIFRISDGVLEPL
jgi:probable phosphoglycerate mutase